jgi:glycosyltransferase involved in cell wall biosynthesis
MIAPTPFFADRGCHVHIAEQAAALQRLGHQVLIVTYGLGRDVPGLSIERTLSVPWYRKLGPGPSWHKFYMDGALLLRALWSARRFKPSIVHAHLHEGCVIGKVVARVYRLPLLFDVQGSLTGELVAHSFWPAKFAWQRRAWRALERWIDHLADGLALQSTEMHRELTQKFAVTPAQMTMAYDGVNVHAFRPGERDASLVRELAIPPEALGKVIVYLGGLSPHKGVDVLLEAFAIIARRMPEAFLLVMGYPGEEAYRQKIAALGLEARVRVLGQIAYETTPRYLALGDIAVAPKRTQTEANGKIYNYMAMGLPTVAFDTVVNRDILGELGVYTHPLQNAEGLAQAILALMSDDSRRRHLAAQVRAKAVADYSWDDVAARLIKAYQQAVDFRDHV